MTETITNLNEIAITNSVEQYQHGSVEVRLYPENSDSPVNIIFDLDDIQIAAGLDPHHALDLAVSLEMAAEEANEEHISNK